MPNRNLEAKNIIVNKHKFRLEIYNKLVDWEIFPHDYSAALYAFSNKDKMTKIIENKYVYEVKK
jgi:hypothetical protein